MKGNKPKVKKNKSKGDFVLGIIIIIFAIVGLSFVVYIAAGQIKNITNQTQLKNEYESFLSPVVMNDPATFDDISKADMSQLMEISIWSLLQNVDSDKYSFSTTGTVGMVVPQKDIENEFEKLFGKTIKPVNQSVEGSTYEFKYDETNESYIIPITGVEPIYNPKVVKIEKKSNGIKVLTVGYIEATDWQQDDDGNYIEPEPAKYMKITLRDDDSNKYYISAIQATDSIETQNKTTKTSTKKASTTLSSGKSTTAYTSSSSTSGTDTEK